MLGQLFRKILSFLFPKSGQDISGSQSESPPSYPASSDNQKFTNELTAHFTLTEATKSSTAERQGISNQPNSEQLEAIKQTAERMEQVRESLGGVAIIITSWFRSLAVNAAVGGSKTSDHMTGKSVDFVAPGFGTPYEICQRIIESGIEFDQLIFETNAHGSQWVHIGFGSRMRQQVLTYRPSTGYMNGLVK